ncbi:hypothetical protein E2C01_076877 [Portunus trituberculatus]|uniref:Uncharacterized protein n=1 Tax=Portunus trituberculatus TaxID=210409 RepID=A0A5B7IKT2_PORTR|nr:hypothetical protein [Portunus trituberculatus]
MMESSHWLLLLSTSSMPAFLAHALTLNIFINSDLLYASYDTCPSLVKVTIGEQDMKILLCPLDIRTHQVYM